MIIFVFIEKAAKESHSPFCCISDFIAPKQTGIKDYVGMFAVSAGFGTDKLCNQ